MRLLLVSMLAMLIGYDAVAADVKPSSDSPQRAVLSPAQASVSGARSRSASPRRAISCLRSAARSRT